MNRRNFLRSLAVGSAALYLRLAPNIAKAIPAALPTEAPNQVKFIDDDCFRLVGSEWTGHHLHKGRKFSAEEMLAMLPRRRKGYSW